MKDEDTSFVVEQSWIWLYSFKSVTLGAITKKAEIVPKNAGIDEIAIINLELLGQIVPRPKQFNTPRFDPSSSVEIMRETTEYGIALKIRFPIPIRTTMPR